ncbi:hypothetical protein NEHOM01_2040 [Nematocida homosporus]|uniref:uncharacterized protein n=1 Tax=Nematocida homosporus TaxID=1912981 RepID=UPI002220BB18|nr:uncharacterized protein NEHOM01_2040 [Nematocida homosporus]KAI5187244.1 hypothetical protein NEHOM01_2040 [Nematocida homosporus]
MRSSSTCNLTTFPTSSGVSALEYRDVLRYALWDGQIGEYPISSADSPSISAPALSICTISTDEVYIGTVAGEVWRVTGSEKKIVVQNQEVRTYGGCKVSSVVSMHRFKDQLVIVFLVGKVCLYHLERHQVTSEYWVDGTITLSAIKGDLVAYVVNNTNLETYNLQTGQIEKRVCLAAMITRICFLHGEANVVVCGTADGKVTLCYLDTVEADFTFKAHRKTKANEEIFFPVVMLASLTVNELITGGADGKVYLWDIKRRHKISTLYSAKRTILAGEISVAREKKPSMCLVLGSGIESLYAPEPQAGINICIVPLAGQIYLNL